MDDYFMKQIKIVVEKTRDHFSSYVENIPGIYGGGQSAEEAIQSAVRALDLLKKNNRSNHVPPVLKGKYEFSYQFDPSSMLNYYRKFFTNAALERLTGIHQKQIQHYTSGMKKPRSAQAKKFEEAFRQLGNELTSLKLRIS
jgi:predicted RNase H-like HicB family nuclease